MKIVNTIDPHKMLIEDILSQFEASSNELENEKYISYYPNIDEFKEVELDSKWFNRLVEDGLIELN